MRQPVSETLKAARRSDYAAGGFLAILTAFRLWYDSRHDLLQDEAYYWQWSRHLDWGYYDNTPLVALVIRLSTSLLGSTELGVRAGATLCSLIASLFCYLLAKRLLGPTLALLSVIAANLIPLFAAGSVIMTQDPVQLALWAAALYVIHRALDDRPLWWYGAGVLAGLATMAKLNALLLLPGVFLFLLLSPTARETWLRRPQPYLAGLIALAFVVPFIWWNHTHENAFWMHIHSMGTRGSGHEGLKDLGNFLGGQLAVLSPLFFLTYLYTLYDGWKRGVRERDEAILYLWCFSAAVFAVTLVVSFQSKVEANWSVAAYMSGIILITDILWRAWRRGLVGQVWTVLSCSLAALLAVGVLFPALFYSFGLKFPKPVNDPTNQLRGWRTMAQRVEAERSAMGDDPFVFGVNYRLPSEAAFYLPGHPQTYSLFLHDRPSEYLFWENSDALKGRNAIFLSDLKGEEHFSDVRAVFSRVEIQPSLRIYQNPPYAAPIRTIHIIRCYNFQGYDWHRWQLGW